MEGLGRWKRRMIGKSDNYEADKKGTTYRET